LSHLSNEMSDAHCRISSGGGTSRRELYSDSEEILVSVQRPQMFNGIAQFAARADFADRALFIYLPPIVDTQRVTEERLIADLERIRPKVLGALFGAVSCALRDYESVSLNRWPRMADFARWAVAAESGLGLPGGAFLSAYGDNREDAARASLE